jgi:hypothetical protein
MNMISRKLQDATAPVDSDAVLAALERRCAELVVRDGILLEQIIVLEKTAASSGGGETSADDVVQARALIGGAQFIASSARPLPKLAALRAERKVIALALQIGRSERHRMATARATEIWARHFPEIAKMELRRVQLAVELQGMNRAREILRDKITKAGGAGVLSTDSVDLLGFDAGDDEVRWAVERLIADGIATRAEIDRWKAKI